MKNSTLKFNKNGKLRILQISDLQDTKETAVDTLHFLEAAIPAVKPDLIVLTGDQLDVVGYWGNKKTKNQNVRKAIRGIMAPIVDSGIPFLVTFGNHDCQTGVSNAQQAEYYKEFKNCICFNDTDDGRPDVGTFNQVIMSSDCTKPALNIYVVDSNSANPEGGSGYDNVHPNQIQWCKDVCEELKDLNGGQKVPSILFQHIPVCEIYEVLKEVPKGTKDALPSFRARKGKYFVLDDEKITYRGTYGETPSDPDINGGQFDSALEQGDIFAMYFGHDHYNSFIGKYKGIDLGYCPGAGYNTYGLNPRGMRVFDFDENDVTNYETKVIRVNDFYTPHLYQPVKNFVYINAPANVDAAVPFIAKAVAILAVIIALFVLLWHFSPIAGAAILIGIAAVSLICATASFIRNKIERKKILSKYYKN